MRYTILAVLVFMLAAASHCVGATAEIEVTADGVIQTPMTPAAGTERDFTSQPWSTVTVEIHNPGGSDLLLGQPFMTGDAGNFYLWTSNFSRRVAPGASTTLDVSFSSFGLPGTTVTAALLLQHSAPGAPAPFAIEFTGTIPPPPPPPVETSLTDGDEPGGSSDGSGCVAGAGLSPWWLASAAGLLLLRRRTKTCA